MTELHVSAKHKMLVVPKADVIDNMFSTAQEVTLQGNQYRLVPHHPAEAFILRSLGYTVPAPILTHYDWPKVKGIYPAFDAQKQTAALLTMNKRAFVLNSMGTGKTTAALYAWDYLHNIKIAKKLLVVSPLSTIKFTWCAEVFGLFPGMKAQHVHHSSRAKRVEQLRSDADVLVINHDGAKLLEKEILELVADGVIDTMIIDELAVYRNGKSERTKSMKRIAEKMEWVWGMTGSPMPRSPTDVWAQCQIINPSTVDKYFNAFRDKLMTKITAFKYHPKPNAVEKAYEAMQPAVRFTMDDVQELPDLTVRDQVVDMGKSQTVIYKALTAACHAAVGAHEITAANAGAVMNKLLQVATGYVYDKEKKTVSLDGDARMDALIETIDAADRKVLVFVPFIHALDGISKKLADEGIEHAVVSGQTSVTERSDIFNLFQNTDKYKVLLAHPQCLAHGITLTAANVIVWFAPVTSLETYEQANARIRRVGQKHKQLVLHLQGTAVEKRIYKLLRDNQQVQNAFLGMFADETMSNPIT